MRNTLCLCIATTFSILSLAIHAQSWSPSLVVGASQYVGDINDQSPAALARGVVGGGIQFKTKGIFRLNIEGMLTQLKASDANTNNSGRNLSFTTWLSEASITGRFDFVRKENARVIPYISGGAAVFYVNPWSTGPGGNRVSLFRLATEGQGLSQYPEKEIPSKINLSVPFGGGLDISLGKSWRLDFEFMLRKTFTDYIDDVSGTYPDRQALLTAKGPEAVAMSWRGTGSFPKAGTARGNSTDKDWYSSVQFRIRKEIRSRKRASKTKPSIPAYRDIPAAPAKQETAVKSKPADNTAPVVSQPVPEKPVVTPQQPAATPITPDKPAAPEKQEPAPANTQPPQKPDRDGDGIPDAVDMCPDYPGVAKRSGCPVRDSDMDGLDDDEDQCPTVAGPKANKGCPPLDRDRDGVEDAKDKCPDQPGTARFFGCPVPDADNDGVSDEDDKCPDKPGKPQAQGCPVPDQDMDGVEDRNDRCPSVVGIPAENGCPVVPVKASRITFNAGTSQLTATAKQALDSLAKWLIDRPQLLLVIESHVDNSRTVYDSKQLSEGRAMSVYIHLYGNKVPMARMQAVGVGSDKPKADNNTPQGRARNNRIEFRLSE